LQGGHKQRHEHADDGDDDEQLDEREAAAAARSLKTVSAIGVS
jgi:hypothetical protein